MLRVVINYYINVKYGCPSFFQLRSSQFNRDHTKLYQDIAHPTHLFKKGNLTIHEHGSWNQTPETTVSRTWHNARTRLDDIFNLRAIFLLWFYVIIALKGFVKHKPYNMGLVEQVGKAMAKSKKLKIWLKWLNLKPVGIRSNKVC